MTVRRLVFASGLLLGACVIVAITIVAWMVFQPKATGFASGTSVSLNEYRGPSPLGAPSELAATDVVARGEYLTRAADCQACHTGASGVPFAGGRPFKLPFGTIYSPNLTPDRDTGIGAWSDVDFLRAVHDGIGRKHQRLYPAFPYASYTMLADQDVLAIKAYLFSLKPVRKATPENTFSFPFNQRWLMGIWSTLFNRAGRFEPNSQQSGQWNRGAYLVEAAGHCGECHTPRNLLQAMNTRRKFAGGAADGWNAYNISADRTAGIGAWGAEEIGAYLAKGHATGRGTASGPMAEVVQISTSHLTPTDVAAMVTYLRSVPAIGSSAPTVRMAGPAPASAHADGVSNRVGKRIFEGACNSCHAWSGAGAVRAEAQLTGMRSVNDPTAINIAQMILTGTGRQGGGRSYMPAFGAAYTDTEIAATANYVTARFGSSPSAIKAKDVARLRSEG